MATKKINPTSRNTFILKSSDFFDWTTGIDFLNVFESPQNFFEKIKNFSSYSPVSADEIARYSVKTYTNPDFLPLLNIYSKQVGFDRTFALIDKVVEKIETEKDIIACLEYGGKYFKTDIDNTYAQRYSDLLMKKLLSREPWRDVFAALYFERYTEIKEGIKKEFNQEFMMGSHFNLAALRGEENQNNQHIKSTKKPAYLSFDEAYQGALKAKNYDKINMSRADFEKKVDELKTIIKHNPTFDKIFFNDGRNLKPVVDAVFSKLSHTQSIEPINSKYFVPTSKAYRTDTDEALAKLFICNEHFSIEALPLLQEMKKISSFRSNFTMLGFWNEIISHLSLKDIAGLFPVEKESTYAAYQHLASFVIKGFVDTKIGEWTQGEMAELKSVVMTNFPTSDVILHLLKKSQLKNYLLTEAFIVELFELNPLLIRPLYNYLKIVTNEVTIKKIIQEAFLNKDMCPASLPEHWLEYKLWQDADYSILDTQSHFKIEALQKNINVFKNIGFAKKMLAQGHYTLFGFCTQYKTISRQQDLMMEYLKKDKFNPNLSNIFFSNKENNENADFILKAAKINPEVFRHVSWNLWQEADFCVLAMETIEEWEKVREQKRLAELALRASETTPSSNPLKRMAQEREISSLWILEQMPAFISLALKDEENKERKDAREALERACAIDDTNTINTDTVEEVKSVKQSEPILYSVKIKAIIEKKKLKDFVSPTSREDKLVSESNANEVGESTPINTKSAKPKMGF